MPDSTLRTTSSEIRRREHQRLDELTGYRALLRRADILDSVLTREQAKGAVRGYYESMNKGMLLDDLEGDGENALVKMDERAVAEMKRLEPGLYFLVCMRRRQFSEARRSLATIVARLEMDYNEQQDYVKKLDQGKV